MQYATDHNFHLVQVEDDVMRVVNEIRDRWPDLRVMCLPPGAVPGIDEAPYRIVDEFGAVVMNVWQLDQAVINSLHMRDMPGKELEKLFEKEQANLAQQRRAKKEEAREERKDIVSHVWKSPKGKYSFKEPTSGKKIVVEDG